MASGAVEATVKDIERDFDVAPIETKEGVPGVGSELTRKRDSSKSVKRVLPSHLHEDSTVQEKGIAYETPQSTRRHDCFTRLRLHRIVRTSQCACLQVYVALQCCELSTQTGLDYALSSSWCLEELLEADACPVFLLYRKNIGVQGSRNAALDDPLVLSS